jgi:phage virion morphogenesis protein
MSNAVIECNHPLILARLNELSDSISHLAPVLLMIGEALTESTKERFGTQTAPDGSHWDGNAEATIANKGRDQPLTGETGKLQDEISYQIEGNDLLIGSPMIYAAMQQFGGTKEEFPHLWGDIPARPFLGVSEDDGTEILRLLRDHLEN